MGEISGRPGRREGRPAATVVGAGIAGMTAALRLLAAGFDVTVLEKTADVGGKFGALNVNGVRHEHAYHFLADWCVNFWKVVDDIGLSRARDFVRRNAVAFLRRRPAGGGPAPYAFAKLAHAGSIYHFWDNVDAGVIPPDDMIAYVYSLLDLVTEAPDDDPDELEFLNRISVNAFMRSRTYMTDLAALLHQEALLKAFAVPSYETSVRSYRTFVRYFGRDDGGWILRGDSHTAFWAPFLATLHRHDGRDGGPRFRLCCRTSVEDLEVEAGTHRRRPRVSALRVAGPEVEPLMPVEHLVLAVPHLEVARLVERHPVLRRAVPDLLALRKLTSRQMASLDLYFRRPLPGIPPEHVTLIDDSPFADATRPPPGHSVRRHRKRVLANHGGIASRYGLSFVDNYQAWRAERPPKETWLNVVSADFEELSGLADDVAQAAIVDELGHYLDFAAAAVDPDRSHFRANADAPLFMNSVGSWQFRPETRTGRPEYEAHWVHRRVEGLYLAGDYCRSKIDLVCLEGAITTAIAAARAVATAEGRPDAVAEPLVPPEISRHECERAKALLRPRLELATKRRAGAAP